MIDTAGSGWRIGAFSSRTGMSRDTIRYYERIGLLIAPARSESGYRVYREADLGRPMFIRRAKLPGLSLDEIRGLLDVAAQGECQPLRRQVTELLHQKIDECAAKLAELGAFKQSLEERYQLALARQDQPACGCATFPASCGCLPARLQELASPGRENGAQAAAPSSRVLSQHRQAIDGK